MTCPTFFLYILSRAFAEENREKIAGSKYAKLILQSTLSYTFAFKLCFPDSEPIAVNEVALSRIWHLNKRHNIN